MTLTAAVSCDSKLQQRRDALARANEVRVGKAEAKRLLRAGKITLSEAFQMEVCGRASVWELVVSVPRVGKVKAHHALVKAGVQPSKLVGSMTARQLLAVECCVERRTK